MLSLIPDLLFLGEVPTITNTSDPVLLDWLEETVKKEKELYADYVALDLLKLLGQCKADSSHVQEVLALLKFMVEKFTSPSAEVCLIKRLFEKFVLIEKRSISKL